MPGDDRKKRRKRTTDLLPVDLPMAEFTLPGQDVLSDVGEELDAMTEGIRPDPEDFEQALDGVSVPHAGELDVETTVLPDGVDVDPADADLLLDEQGNVVDAAGEGGKGAIDAAVESGEGAVDAAGDVIEIAVDGSGEAATVVIDAGGEAIEVAADVGGDAAEAGGEVAAEVVLEVVAGALDGL